MVTFAGLSEAAFYEVFESLESCFSAAVAEGSERISRALSDATRNEHRWLARVRAGVVGLLAFLDEEPGWGRLLVLELPSAGAMGLRQRQHLHGLVRDLLEEGTRETQLVVSQRLPASRLRAELVAGGVLSVIRSTMQARRGESLVPLAPPLMSFIAGQYLGQTAARIELTGHVVTTDGAFPRVEVLPVRATHRTTLVLRAIAAAPRSSNRAVAHAAGLSDEGQTSKLLARLEQRGLIENVGAGASWGEPNAWLLTQHGRDVVQVIGDSVAEGVSERRLRRIRGSA